MTTLSEIKAAQPEWFSRKNKKFFGDVWYKVSQGKVSKKPYLVRATYAWTDMFGQDRKLHYRVNRIDENLEIGELVDEVFSHEYLVKLWLQSN